MGILEITNEEDLTIAPKANAFRVLDDGTGVSCFLDFLEYDPEENKARVISRIHISRGFLSAIQDRLNFSLREIKDENLKKG